MTTAVSNYSEAAGTQFDIRREVKKRVWVCPGAGFTLLGRPVAAASTYLSGVASAVAAIALAWEPTRFRLTMFCVLLVLSTVLWIAELFFAYASWPLRAAAPSNVGYRLAATIMWTLVFVLAFVVLTSYRFSTFSSEGMSPLLHDGDRLLMQTRVDDDRLQRGKLMMFRLSTQNKFTEAGKYMLGRILAMPGDTIALRDDHYFVNGKIERRIALTEPYPIAIGIARYPGSTTVPPGCFFIVQDAPDDGLDSRVFSWAQYNDVVSTRLYRLGGLPPIRPLE